jgi:hypothetical protein
MGRNTYINRVDLCSGSAVDRCAGVEDLLVLFVTILGETGRHNKEHHLILLMLVYLINYKRDSCKTRRRTQVLLMRPPNRGSSHPHRS